MSILTYSHFHIMSNSNHNNTCIVFYTLQSTLTFSVSWDTYCNSFSRWGKWGSEKLINYSRLHNIRQSSKLNLGFLPLDPVPFPSVKHYPGVIISEVSLLVELLTSFRPLWSPVYPIAQVASSLCLATPSDGRDSLSCPWVFSGMGNICLEI